MIRLLLTCVAALTFPAATAVAQSRLVIVSGLGGQPKYTQAFGALSTALAQAAHERAGLAESAIVWLGDTAAPRSRWYRGASTKENVETTLARLAEADSGEQVIVVIIGHGSGEGIETRVSLPGPDMTARDFARTVSRFGKRPVAFINLTSASGDMLPLLAAPGRVVMTATKSAFERNESHFGRFFVDALSRDGADTDKDGRVSLLEAFHFAEAETKRFYETDGKLATEHPQIADESQLARRFFLAGGGGRGPGGAGRADGSAGARGRLATTSSDPRLASLYGERQRLDEQIQALKNRKTGMTVVAYEQELERLLLALALKAREIRQMERGG